MKILFKTAVFVFLSVFFMISSAVSQEIKIGFAGVISGDLAPYGISALRGVELAIRDLNDQGGILGRQVELLVGDDVCKPEVAVNAAQKLVSDGAQMIVGHICSGATMAANKIYKDARLVVVSPAATNENLTSIGDNPNFFRTISPDGAEAGLMAYCANEMVKAKKVALIYEQNDRGEALMTEVRNIIKSDGRLDIVIDKGVAENMADPPSVVGDIRPYGADVIMWGGSALTAAQIIARMPKDTTFIGGGNLYGDDFKSLLSNSTPKIYVIGQHDIFSNPLARELRNKYQSTYGDEPGAFFLNAYACVQALAAAAQRAGSLDYDRLRDAMFEISVDSPLGQIGFHRSGDVYGFKAWTIYQIIGGDISETGVSFQCSAGTYPCKKGCCPKKKK